MTKKTLYEGKYKRFVSHRGWEFVERVKCGGVVVILAMTEDGKVLLVEQERVPVGKRVIELPAGLANDKAGHENETLEQAALRELHEETGYHAEQMTLLFHGPLSPASSVDIASFFRATGLSKTGSGGGDEQESIVTHEIALAGIDAWLHAREGEGILIDPKIYAGLYFLKQMQARTGPSGDAS
ncbi:MAG: NUDIX hydrolase [Candidatus Omnitrophota bacterium]